MKAPAAKKDRKRHNIVDPREAVSKAEDYEPPSKIDKDSESPEDWLNAPEDFMSVAKLANIPAENTHKFLHAFNRAVYDFRLTSLLDADRRNYEDPIKEIYAACEALIIALDYLDECEGGPAMLDCFFSDELHSCQPRPREDFFSGWQEVAFINGDWDRALDGRGSLGDLNRRLGILWHVVGTRLLTKRAISGQSDWDPLGHGNKTRTSDFMETIIVLCEIYGGNLTYNKHYHTGTLADVYEHFRKQAPEFWTDLSPATLQGLKKRSKD